MAGIVLELFGGCFGVIRGTWVGFWGLVVATMRQNAQCSGRSSKSDAKVRKIFEICKFRGMKKYEKYIKVVKILAYVIFFYFVVTSVLPIYYII